MYKPTKLEKIDALMHARRRIANGSKKWICRALPNNPTGDYLRRYIENKIQPWGTYNSWMSEHHPTKYYKMSTGDMRRARLQWIDWMIANAT